MPGFVTVEMINKILENLHLSPIETEELVPIEAGQI